MSDTGEGDAGKDGGTMGKKKSLSLLLSKKLHNPFKRSNSSSSDDDKSRSPVQKASSSGKKFSFRSPNKSTTQIPTGMADHSSIASKIKPRDPAAPIPQEERLNVVTRESPAVAAAVAKAVSQPPPEAGNLEATAASRTKAATMEVTEPSKSTAVAIQEQVDGPSQRGEGIVPRPESRIKPPQMKGQVPDSVPLKETVAVGGPVYGVAEIAILGIKGDPDAAMTALRSRGFVIHLAVLNEEQEPTTLTAVVGMGPKLLVKCAIERNMDKKDREQYTSGEMAKLCDEALFVIRRSGLQFDEMNIMHDKKALERVARAPRESAADEVNEYFGPYIGLYFAWLRSYTRALILPMIGGVFLFLTQWRAGTADVPWLPVFCILLMVWATIFLELWRRRNSEIAFRWDVTGVEDEALMRVAADKSQEFKSSSAGKFCVTIPIIVLAIYLVIRAMLYSIWLSDNATTIYGEDSWLKHYPLFLYSSVPMMTSYAYTMLAKVLNDFEEHPTAVRKKNMMVVKMFAFQFVNSYCALLYVGFWLRDLDRLRFLLVTLMMFKQFTAQLQEKYTPMIKSYLQERKEKKNPAKMPKFLVAHTDTIKLDELMEELKAHPADMEDDYLEMVLQFGYLSMFAVVFPLAPLFAYINNVWEFQLDLHQLVKTRRPESLAESSIGAWQLCLELIVVMACLTNLLLAMLISENIQTYVPKSWADHFGSLEGKVVAAVVAEHLLLLGKTLMVGLIDKAPRVVREAQALIAVKQKEERREYRRLASGLPPSQRVGNERGPGSREQTAKERLEALHTSLGVWHFGPRWYLPLAVLPFVVAWLEMSAWVVLPVAFVFVSYLQHVKDKAAKALSIGVVSDPKVLQLITKFLPPWYSDSEVSRVEWLNKVIDKLWISASGATKDLLFTTVQPILDAYRPSGVSALGFRKVSLGTVPPKIVGVRALEMMGDKAVIDVDVRWVGNAEIVLEAGVKPVPILVTLDKIKFSGKLRVELAPIVPVFPCFGALVLTFMEKPFLDFAFSLGKLDVMSIGPGDVSVGNAVSRTIEDILDSMMVFPHKLVVPMVLEQDLLNLANPTPTGVVELTMVGADKLRAADITGKSDPYAKIKLGRDQLMRTEIIKKNLNPRWNETFDLLVYEPSVEVLEIGVYDHDSGPGSDDFLGNCELPLSVLKPDVESSHNIPLSKTKSGSVLLKATLVSLASGAKRKEIPDDDVLVSNPVDAITDDMVGVDVYRKISEKDATNDESDQKSKDPNLMSPRTVLNPSDTTMGVLTVMGIEVRGVKAGDRYVSVICGNTKRKTAVEEDKTSFAYTDVFHFLIRGAKSAILEVLLKEKETIGNDKVMGSIKIRVAEVIANDDLLDGEWDLAGDHAQGSIKMRLKWSGRPEQEDGSS